MPATGLPAAADPPVWLPAADERRQLRTADFDELAQAVRQWQLAFRQLSRGPFDGELQRAQAGDVQVVRITTNRVILARGAFRPGVYCFSLVTALNEAATWRGHHLRA